MMDFLRGNNEVGFVIAIGIASIAAILFICRPRGGRT
jgi:hypothetical protein